MPFDNRTDERPLDATVASDVRSTGAGVQITDYSLSPYQPLENAGRMLTPDEQRSARDDPLDTSKVSRSYMPTTWIPNYFVG